MRSLLAIVLLACQGPGTTRTPLDDEPIDTADSGDTADTDVQRPASRLDAALAWPGTRTYFFAGEEYMRFDSANGEVDAGYPLDVATYWVAEWPTLDAATLRTDDEVLFFRGSEVQRYDRPGDVVIGSPEPIGQAFPGIWEDGVDAVATIGTELTFFRDGEYRVFDTATQTASASRPLAERGIDAAGIDAAFADGNTLFVFHGETFTAVPVGASPTDSGRFVFAWPGLWDPEEGTGVPGTNLPSTLRPLLLDSPSADELAARKARVLLSISGSDYVNLSADYPLYTHSIEERLGAWGCLILHDTVRDVHRFRCATDSAGPGRIDIEPYSIDFIDWRNAAHHVDQTSQGDFSADPGTPWSIFDTDDGVFYVDRVSGNSASGSINGGLNIRVRWTKNGIERSMGISHLNTAVPGYVLDAASNGTSLPAGTVFGFVGYTGNLWIAAPPTIDAPYDVTGAGLPVSHSHLWFIDQSDNHTTLSRDTREAIDYSGRYPYGGG
ncbi:MAG: hypothetical protein KC912_13550 [Proteobacteria bacterium]|nr:hypothetical protein [Pseudomonadota bacterium]